MWGLYVPSAQICHEWSCSKKKTLLKRERERIGIGGRRWITVYSFATERSRKLSSSWQGSGGSERLPASLDERVAMFVERR